MTTNLQNSVQTNLRAPKICLHGANMLAWCPQICLYRVLQVDGEPATFIHLVLAFQSVIKVMINLAELCLLSRGYVQGQCYSVHTRRYSLAILQTGRRSRAVKIFEEEWHQLQKAQA